MLGFRKCMVETTVIDASESGVMIAWLRPRFRHILSRCVLDPHGNVCRHRGSNAPEAHLNSMGVTPSFRHHERICNMPEMSLGVVCREQPQRFRGV